MILLPAGTFTLDSATVTLSKKIVLQGAGMNATILSAASDPVLLASATFVTIQDLAITASTGVGIQFTSADYGAVRRYYANTIGTGVATSNSLGVVIRDSLFVAGANGVTIAHPSSVSEGGGLIQGNIFTGQTTASIIFASSGGWRIADNRFLAIAVNGINFTYAGASTITGLTITGNTLAACATSCITLGVTGGGLLTRVLISNNDLAPTGTGNGLVMSGTVSNTEIVGNQIGTLDTKFGISLASGPTNLLIASNYFHGPGSGTATGITVNAAVTGLRYLHNTYDSLVAVPFVFSTAAALIHDESGTALASLPSTASNGSLIYCSDCQGSQDAAYAAGTCIATGAHTGAFARRQNGTWQC